MGIPWEEAAVLVEQAPGAKGERRIVDEGSLLEICKRLQKQKFIMFERLTVSLPDRRAPPVGFSADALSMLLVALKFQ